MKKVILVIDDEIDILTILCDLLEMEGYDVKKADDGQSGLMVYLEVKPNLIITDLMMPFMDGHELINIIRNKKKDLKTPIIAMSAGILDNKTNTAWSKFIKKPSSLDVLLEEVNNLLKK